MRLYPTKSPILRLSIEGSRPEALQVAVKARFFLDMPGVDSCGDQRIKTCGALEFFTTRFAHPWQKAATAEAGPSPSSDAP